MTKNQKFAIGCGGAGCLGLIVVIAASAILYFYLNRQPTVRTADRNSNFNINTNRGSNSNTSSESSDETSSSSMSNDDKHKLFQAAGMTSDSQLVLRVLEKIGFASGTGSEYEAFVNDHAAWALNNPQFIISVNTPEKARAYVEAHLDD
ncbi:MAG: hypothetical protein ABR568_06765 [Pyrinomonadaceae bacterium]